MGFIYKCFIVFLLRNTSSDTVNTGSHGRQWCLPIWLYFSYAQLMVHLRSQFKVDSINGWWNPRCHIGTNFWFFVVSYPCHAGPDKDRKLRTCLIKEKIEAAWHSWQSWLFWIKTLSQNRFCGCFWKENFNFFKRLNWTNIQRFLGELYACFIREHLKYMLIFPYYTQL